MYKIYNIVPGIRNGNGNYSGEQLASALEYSMTTATGIQIKVLWDSQISRFKFISLIGFQIIAGSSGSYLGLPEELFPVSPEQNWTALKAGVLLPFTEISVCSNIVEGSDNGVITWKNNPTDSSNILAIVPINSCFNSIVQWNSSSDLPFYSISQSRFNSRISEINFSLRFPDGSLVNLNGYNWSALLIIEF